MKASHLMAVVAALAISASAQSAFAQSKAEIQRMDRNGTASSPSGMAGTSRRLPTARYEQRWGAVGVEVWSAETVTDSIGSATTTPTTTA